MEAEEEEPSERGLNKAWSCNRVQKGKCFWAVNESQTRNPALFPPCDRRREGRGAAVPRMRNRFLARWGGAAVENLGRFCVEEEMESSHFQPGWLNKGQESTRRTPKVEEGRKRVFHQISPRATP